LSSNKSLKYANRNAIHYTIILTLILLTIGVMLITPTDAGAAAW